MKMILLGAPGAGKGTQAEIVSKKLKIPIIGTGNIIREAINSGSELGKRFQSYTEHGKLVPDELVVEMVANHLSRLKQPDGRECYILDGFPRTVVQAQEFEEMGGKVDAVIKLEITDEEIIARMTGRRICTRCGTPYHIANNPPKEEGVCDKCSGALCIRNDDAPEMVLKRLEVYHEQTEPLVDYYRDHGILTTIDATMEMDKVTAEILSVLGVD
ncbi:adenylate kinase [Oscillospiraceae bacterium LTW-04]|nr:adenylate kinase [Oscillospiraceae bacterium MB24-C1]